MEHYFKVTAGDLALFGNLKTFTCPLCGKSLINLSVIENKREFWCDCSDENYFIDILED